MSKITWWKKYWWIYFGVVVIILGVVFGIFYVVNGRDNSIILDNSIIPLPSSKVCPSGYSSVVCSTNIQWSSYTAPRVVNGVNVYIVAGDSRAWVYPSKVYDYCDSLIYKSPSSDNTFCAKVFTVINGEVK